MSDEVFKIKRRKKCGCGYCTGREVEFNIVHTDYALELMGPFSSEDEAKSQLSVLLSDCVTQLQDILRKKV